MSVWVVLPEHRTQHLRDYLGGFVLVLVGRGCRCDWDDETWAYAPCVDHGPLVETQLGEFAVRAERASAPKCAGCGGNRKWWAVVEGQPCEDCGLATSGGVPA